MMHETFGDTMNISILMEIKKELHSKPDDQQFVFLQNMAEWVQKQIIILQEKHNANYLEKIIPSQEESAMENIESLEINQEVQTADEDLPGESEVQS